MSVARGGWKIKLYHDFFILLTLLERPSFNIRAQSMGLEIFYDLHAPGSWSALKVRRTVMAARQHALTLGFELVDEVERNDPGHPRTMGVRRRPKNLGYVSADAEDGWFFRTWSGQRCETAVFGLCRFPARVTVKGVSVAFGWGNGWHFHSWCKTQYADLVSRAHFLKCHLGVISILDFFRGEGCRVYARDGGEKNLESK